MAKKTKKIPKPDREAAEPLVHLIRAEVPSALREKLKSHATEMPEIEREMEPMRTKGSGVTKKDIESIVKTTLDKDIAYKSTQRVFTKLMDRALKKIEDSEFEGSAPEAPKKTGAEKAMSFATTILSLPVTERVIEHGLAHSSIRLAQQGVEFSEERLPTEESVEMAGNHQKVMLEMQDEIKRLGMVVLEQKQNIDKASEIMKKQYEYIEKLHARMGASSEQPEQEAETPVSPGIDDAAPPMDGDGESTFELSVEDGREVVDFELKPSTKVKKKKGKTDVPKWVADMEPVLQDGS